MAQPLALWELVSHVMAQHVNGPPTLGMLGLACGKLLDYGIQARYEFGGAPNSFVLRIPHRRDFSPSYLKARIGEDNWDQGGLYAYAWCHNCDLPEGLCDCPAKAIRALYRFGRGAFSTLYSTDSVVWGETVTYAPADVTGTTYRWD